MSKKSGPDGQPRRSFIEQARRAQIIEAATQVVAEVGYASASLARIAEQADISKSVITYHFSGKDEILRLVVAQFFERAWEYMQARIEKQNTARGQVHAWIGSQLEFFEAHRAEFLAMSEIVTNHRAPDGSHAFADDLAEEVDGLAEILAHGQHSGELRAFDARSVANIILRCADGVLGSWAVDADADLPGQAVTLLDFIDHAIKKEPG